MFSKMMTSTALQVAGLGLLFFDRLILSSILLRVWNVGIFEDWSLLLAGAGMLNLLDFGLHQTFSNAYTRHFQSGDVARFSRQMAIGLAVMGIISLAGVTGLVGGILSGLWHRVVVTRTLPDGDAAIALLLLGIAVIVQTFAGVTSPIYRAQDRFSRGLAVDLGNGAARLLVSTLVAVAGGGVVAVAAGYLLATMAMFANALRDQFLRLTGLTARPKLPTREELMEFGKPAAWFYVQHASNVLLLGAPLLVLGEIRTASGGIAAFGIIRTLTNLIRQVNQTLANTPAVELSRIWFHSNDFQLIRDRMSRACRFIATIAGVMVGGLLPLVGLIFKVWSGGSVEPRLDVAAIFCLGVVLTGPSSLIASFLNYIDDARIGAYSRLVSLPIAAVAGIALVGRFELAGVACALVLGELIGFWLFYLPSAERWTGVNKYALSLRWTGLSLLGAAPVFVTSMAFRSMPASFSTILLASMALPVVAAATLMVVGMSAADRSRFTDSALRRIRGWAT